MMRAWTTTMTRMQDGVVMPFQEGECIDAFRPSGPPGKSNRAGPDSKGITTQDGASEWLEWKSE